jgi:hypothetical protein
MVLFFAGFIVRLLDQNAGENEGLGLGSSPGASSPRVAILPFVILPPPLVKTNELHRLGANQRELKVPAVLALRFREVVGQGPRRAEDFVAQFGGDTQVKFQRPSVSAGRARMVRRSPKNQ